MTLADDVRKAGSVVWHEEDNQYIPMVCTYFPCIVAIESGRNCADFRACNTYKFYQKFPDYLNKEEKRDATAKDMQEL